jgi:ABC-2 type transport system ATP-binding protein
MIEARALTKRYGRTVAVDGLSFEVRPGHVTGFLGPNGSGKSTTMRMIMGLDAPDGGRVIVNGRSYAELGWPLREGGRCSRPRPSTPDAAPPTTSWPWPRPTTSLAHGWTRSSTSWV